MVIPDQQNQRGPPDILRTPSTLPDQSRVHGTRRVPLALITYRQLTELRGKAIFETNLIIYLEIKRAERNDTIF